MYVGEGGYASDPSVKKKVKDIVAWTKELGIYVVIDWCGSESFNANSSAASMAWSSTAPSTRLTGNFRAGTCSHRATRTLPPGLRPRRDARLKRRVTLPLLPSPPLPFPRVSYSPSHDVVSALALACLCLFYVKSFSHDVFEECGGICQCVTH